MIRTRLARASRKDLRGPSLGDGPYGIGLIYCAYCNYISPMARISSASFTGLAGVVAPPAGFASASAVIRASRARNSASVSCPCSETDAGTWPSQPGITGHELVQDFVGTEAALAGGADIAADVEPVLSDVAAGQVPEYLLPVLQQVDAALADVVGGLASASGT